MITLEKAMKMVDTLDIKTPEECKGFLKGIFFSMKIDGGFKTTEEKKEDIVRRPVNYNSFHDVPINKLREIKNNSLVNENTIALSDYIDEDDVHEVYVYLEDLIEEYGEATIHDMKEEFGISSCYLDRKRGWNFLPDWNSYKECGFDKDLETNKTIFHFPTPIDL